MITDTYTIAVDIGQNIEVYRIAVKEKRRIFAVTADRLTLHIMLRSSEWLWLMME